MKKLLFLLLLVPCVAMVQPDLGGITTALRTGNADDLGQFFGDNVEISLLSNKDNYNRTDAIRMMKSFFMKNPPKSYSTVHQGVSKGGFHYAIGEMKATAQAYRFYLLLEDKGGTFVIKRIEVSVTK